MDILSSNKVLQLEPLAPLIRQGERLADNPVFVLPKMRDGIDQTALAWEIRATSDHDTIVIQSLTADLTGTDIRLPWVVEGEFTAVAGALYITLCGKSATSDIVVKYVGSTALRVLAAEEGAYAPPPNIAEQTYQQRAAAEAAAASADATLAQTQALNDQVQVIVAGNEAHTKSESNARFAGALVVKESGNPITVYPDATGAPLTAISQRGKTTQSGTGDPSPTNIRPIYGVGQFDKKVVVDGKISTFDPVDLGTVLRCPITTPLAPDLAGQANAKTIKALSSWLPFDSSYTGDYEHVSLTTTTCYFFISKSKLSGYTKQDVNNYFASHPLTIYYQSTSYATATQVYVGLSVTDETGYHGYAAGPMNAPLFDGDTVDFVSGIVLRNSAFEMLNGNSGWIGFSVQPNGVGYSTAPGTNIPNVGANAIEAADSRIVTQASAGNIPASSVKTAWEKFYISSITATTLDELKSELTNHPVNVIYRRATPTTETVPISEPITYAPGPITIAAENTVDVTYNKSLAKAFEQITAAIASLGTV